MSDLYIEARLQAIKDIASASCTDIKDADNIADFCDEIYSAIEIVKQGGISDASDYVCKWRLCDEEANVYDTSCRNPHILIEGTPQENNYEFCPYCGKKIKIVGD